ncbi:O-antigen ligase family protein [Vibrio breoganii]|nr:O-antigen ligase family protein [Vibrio breoganii]PMI18451.1 hypothetical protein BCU49_12185 [Vibrio breoganii]
MRNSLNEKLVSLVIAFPFFWSFSGLFIYNDAKKEFTLFSGIALVVFLLFSNKIQLKKLLLENKFFIVIFINAIFAIFAYSYYGYSSNRFRALITLLFIVAIIPKEIYERIELKWLMLFLSSFFVIYAIKLYAQGNLFNRSWDINPIHYATVCAVVLSISFYKLLTEKKNNDRVVYLLIFAISASVLLLSDSRGPWIAAFSGVILSLIMILVSSSNNGKAKLAVLAIALMGLTGFVFKDHISKRISTSIIELQRIESGDLNSSVGLRLQMWKAGWLIFRDYPVLGAGEEIVDIKKEFLSSGIITNPRVATYTHFHNQFINDAAKYGLVGLFILLFSLLFVVYLSKDNKYRNIIFLVLLVYIVCSLTDVPFRNAHPLIFYYMLINFLLVKGSKKSVGS